MSAREERRDSLFDLLVAMPEGVTVNEIGATLSIPLWRVNEVIRDLRLLLGDTDDINLVCTPQGQQERWNYALVGNLDGAREWTANRVGDTASRIRTMQAVMRSVVSASDGRTLDGKRARVIERSLRRLIEDLDDLTV